MQTGIWAEKALQKRIFDMLLVIYSSGTTPMAVPPATPLTIQSFLMVLAFLFSRNDLIYVWVNSAFSLRALMIFDL
jgi:hypothetical protein